MKDSVFGIETEYGITVVGQEEVDVVAESIDLVRAWKEPGTLMKWDYRSEDPHIDARGFRARELLQDTDEANYFEIDRNRPLSFQEIKSDLVLWNGARFYNDHAHPEYSTPECSTLAEIVAQDKVGEWIVQECAHRRNRKLGGGREVRIYKNNTDFDGHSYGCHENYLMSRAVPWDRLAAGTMPFLVTRQIFAGAGKLGIEAEGRSGPPGMFQISQRADFFSVLMSIDTMNKRPLVNTRDEPHADAALFRRFHVIIGDANLSEYATALKIGTTLVVLELIERGVAPEIELAQPIEATKAISRDPTFAWIVELRDGRKISAVDLQRLYLEQARAHISLENTDFEWIMTEWERTLNDLAIDPMRCADRLDWAAKRNLLMTFQQSEGLEWGDPWLQSIDLEYHNLDPEQGLYFELVREGAMQRFVTDKDIFRAAEMPPPTTRAWFRGRSVAKFASQIATLQWDAVTFKTTSTPTGYGRIPMPEGMGQSVDELNRQIDRAIKLDDLQGLFK